MQDQKKIRVLLLPKWYPHRYDPMPGLFIQRQAEVVSSDCDIAVLYVHEDPRSGSAYEIVDSVENNVHVVRIYYRLYNCGPRFLFRFVRFCRFFRANLIGLQNLRSFSPDLLHVHVLTRLGLVALLYKLLKGTPYIITEHWSRYFPLNGSYNGLIRKTMTRLVVHFSSATVAVSEKLKMAMVDRGIRNRNFRVIPNPVDMDKFKKAVGFDDQKPAKKIIIHISCFEDRSKNISGFLKVIKQISEKRGDFECRLIGDGPDRKDMMTLSDELGLLDKFVFFPGLKEDEDLVKAINEADFLVLSSHYETFGSVVIEGLACGLPVVATDVGVAGEVLDVRNGMIVTPGDETELEKALDKMIDCCRDYDKTLIRKSVSGKYNNKIIREQLYHLYNEILTG